MIRTNDMYLCCKGFCEFLNYQLFVTNLCISDNLLVEVLRPTLAFLLLAVQRMFQYLFSQLSVYKVGGNIQS